LIVFKILDLKVGKVDIWLLIYIGHELKNAFILWNPLMVNVLCLDPHYLKKKNQKTKLQCSIFVSPDGWTSHGIKDVRTVFLKENYEAALQKWL
jgi:hypothetical protein